MQKPLYIHVIDQNIDNIYIYLYIFIYLFIYVAGVDPLSVFCSYGEKFVADWSVQLG